MTRVFEYSPQFRYEADDLEDFPIRAGERVIDYEPPPEPEPSRQPWIGQPVKIPRYLAFLTSWVNLAILFLGAPLVEPLSPVARLGVTTAALALLLWSAGGIAWKALRA